MKVLSLKQQLADYKKENPKARIYNTACDLGVSELEILEISEDLTITYLGNPYKSILQALAPLGRVMALTRNHHAVSETKGIYDQVSFMEKAPMGIAHNEIIDMRYFISNWAHAYAVQTTTSRGESNSLQFFDKYGTAVHKIYATPETDLEAFHALVEKYKSKVPIRIDVLETKLTASQAHTAMDNINVGAFQTEWLNMKDTHDFFGLLRKYNLDHQDAFRLAPEGAAYQVSKESIVQMLQGAVAKELPIMVFLGNPSCLQIFSGKINKLFEMGDWYNVMDEDFNLHLKMSSIENAWVVKKYTSDGIVTSLELFDADGQHILYCFSKRKPGIPELLEWRELVRQLK
jgi:putative hemin transport protein